jgi:beta-lactamase class A
MGRQSDNTAFNVARNYLGEDKIKEYLVRFGMRDTSLSENETTPYDIGNFFENLWNDNLLSAGDRDELLSNLTDTLYEEWLAAGIPSNVRVSHKYGRELHVVNDAGIVFADNPFVIVIVSKGAVEREADEIFPELARSIYNIESSP